VTELLQRFLKPQEETPVQAAPKEKKDDTAD
jgi:hypothetical protein